MQTWLNFWNFFFWLSILGFVINIENFFKILLYSEITWITLYVYTVLCGGINDDLTLVSTSFFIIGLAGLEFSVGILLLILFKNINKSLSIIGDENNFENITFFNKKKTYQNRFYWSKSNLNN